MSPKPSAAATEAAEEISQASIRDRGYGLSGNEKKRLALALDAHAAQAERAAYERCAEHLRHRANCLHEYGKAGPAGIEDYRCRAAEELESEAIQLRALAAQDPGGAK